MRALLERYTEALRQADVTACFQRWSTCEPATDADIDELVAFLGCPLPPDLESWLRHLGRELPFVYNYGAIHPKRVLSDLKGSAGIDFSRHLKNVRSWKDGRWDDGRIQPTYWSQRWVPVAQDGCGNQVCVDLAPGPKGQIGQLISMEFQDGQGPYLNQHASLRDFVETHVRMLEQGRFTVDEEGFVEFEG